MADSLYNPHYGYFSKQVVIFTPGDPFDFPRMRDESEFHTQLGRRYTAFEDALDAEDPSDTRQLWHTPTELFSPHYGEAVARYLCANYRLTSFPTHDLIVYEMGAGRGTLMLNVLDFLRAADPEVYARTRFNVIEISSSLAAVQARALTRTAAARGHRDRVAIVNRSVFDWAAAPEPSPCFFLAFEVFDNFAHDALRYDLATGAPLQAVVLVAASGDLYEFYTPHLDPAAARFLRVRHAATAGRHPRPAPASRLGRWLHRHVHPFGGDLSAPEYVPTRLIDFFAVLERSFPAHRLVASDFHSLPDAVEGLNAPVVQTRYQRRPVPVTTPLVCFCCPPSSLLPFLPSSPPLRWADKKRQVHQGYFDIMFPTDFNVVEAIYRAMTGRLSRVLTHEDFMRRWAYVGDTETQSGENPLLSWYKNASVMTTV